MKQTCIGLTNYRLVARIVGESQAGLGLAVLSLHFICGIAMGQTPTNAAYTFTTLAGYPGLGSADGIGGGAQFYSPLAVAVDSGGNVFIADALNHTIRKLTPAGVVSTIAGWPGNTGSADGIGSNARFNTPYGIAVDGGGNLYVSDNRNCTVRKITPSGTNWIVSTIAGVAGSVGSADGTNSSARFGTIYYGGVPSGPSGITTDGAGNIFVSDHAATIRKLEPVGTNWVVSTIAGTAEVRAPVDGVGTNANFFTPAGIAAVGSNNLFVVDQTHNTVRKLALVGNDWVVTTIAGQIGPGGSTDGTNNAALFNNPRGLAADTGGNLYVADSANSTIRRVTPLGTNWVVNTFAGLALNEGNANGVGNAARFNHPAGVAVSASGSVYVADTPNQIIRKITSAGYVTTVAGSVGSQGSVDGVGNAARFNHPQGIAAGSGGNIFVADSENHIIRQITSAGVVSLVAGGATNPGSLDGIASNARFNYPGSLALDSAGNIFVADYGNHTIRKITLAGVVSTIAGSSGNPGFTDGTNNTARFYNPAGITADSAGNLYVADELNNRIRRLTASGTNWVVSTIAGRSPGTTDGTGTNAQFYGPRAVTVDNAGILYVADSRNSTIRKITAVGSNWVVSTIAGAAQNPGSADGVGSAARFGANIASGVGALVVDGSGTIYVADTLNHTIRRLSPVGANWTVSTIGGMAASGGSSDGAGTASRFVAPGGIAVDAAGALYIGDSFNNTVRLGLFTQYSANNPVSFIQPPMNAQLAITILPSEANGQWRFAWELGWRNSGQMTTNLVQGNYPLEFRNVPGWLPIPPSLTVAVTNGGTTFLTNQYYPTLNISGTNTGTLTVNIGPNPPAGANWRLVGETESDWRSPGFTLTNLLPDAYFIEFRPVSGRSKPSTQAVQVSGGLPSVISVNYLLAQSTPGSAILPTPVPAASINNPGSYPFAFNGQLRSDGRHGSGAAVGGNVVLTAAHLVFNDQSLSYARHVWWFFQREAGVFEPQPLLARGWYLLGGYASQRTNDLAGGLGPDQSSPQSRNMDVAAIYFPSSVAGGGHGGYLPSDASPNPWLTGNALKMLVGYPVDGALFGDVSIVPGNMYQTLPQPYPLSRAIETLANQQVYLAPWFFSYPGNSGGPLYVQFNGYFYPAGIYVGTLYNGVQPYASVVRAIDSNVVSLITLAATLGDTGTNNTGGGVITIIAGQGVSASNPGYVQFLLAPSAAVQAGAGWRLQGDPSYASGSNYTRAVTSTNGSVVEFKPIPGWNLPTNQTVVVSAGALVQNLAFYSVTNPLMRLTPGLGLQITGTTGTAYRIEYRTNLTAGAWLPLRTNTLTGGFNLVTPWPPTNGSSAFYRAIWLP